MQLFFDKVDQVSPAARAQMVGYSPDELGKIERLYGIGISGQFRQFLLRAGRCDGGVIGDDPLIIYRPAWSVRAQILFQVNFFTALQDIGAYDFLNSPFAFSREAETQYYYLQTAKQDDRVYHYDENTGTVVATGMNLQEYLIGVLARYPVEGPLCKGDLLSI